MKRVLLILLVFAVVGGLVYVFRNGLLQGTSKEEPIETTPVTVKDIEETIECVGEIMPASFTEIKSEVSGLIEGVFVEPGQKVKAGDLLVQLDPSELQSQIKEAEHEIEASRLMLDKVQLDYDSKEDLRSKDFVTERELREAKIDRDLARNELDIRKARLQTLKERLAKTAIRAPHAGIVLNLIARPGMVITGASSFNEGKVMMEVADLKTLEVETEVNEVDASRLKMGGVVDLTFDSIEGLTIPGRIILISPSARKKTGQYSTLRVFPILISFQAADRRIRPGMTAKVSFMTASVEQALTASLPAVFTEGETTYVYVRDEEAESFEKREVEIGISDRDSIEIRSGLREGELLALSPPEAAERTGS